MKIFSIKVGDKSGYCKLLVWDDAVLSFSRISEGDVLVLGRYTQCSSSR